MDAKKLTDILTRQYRYHDRMKMTLDERVKLFVKSATNELEKAGLQIEREPDIDLADFPRVLEGKLDEVELDEISDEQAALIEEVRALLGRVRSS